VTASVLQWYMCDSDGLVKHFSLSVWHQLSAQSFSHLDIECVCFCKLGCARR